jgi:hypothetical protein
MSINPFIHPRRCRHIVFAIFLAPATLWPATLTQKNPPIPPADADSPVLIWDVELNLATSLPRNFRTTDDPLKAKKGELPSDAGLADLRASGSGEFTVDGFKLLLARARPSHRFRFATGNAYICQLSAG